MLGVQIMLIKISLLLLHPLHQPQKHSNTLLCALHIISLSLFPCPDSWSRRLFPVAGRWAISRQVCLIWRGSGCDVYHSVCWVATHSRCDRLISLPPFSSFKTVFSPHSTPHLVLKHFSYCLNAGGWTWKRGVFPETWLTAVSRQTMGGKTTLIFKRLLFYCYEGETLSFTRRLDGTGLLFL